MLNFVNEKFGLGEPDKIVIGGFENAVGDAITSGEILYELYYGDNNISVSWNITNEQVYSVIGKGLN